MAETEEAINLVEGEKVYIIGEFLVNSYYIIIIVIIIIVIIKKIYIFL